MSQGLALESGEFIPAEELNKMMNAKSKCAQCGKGYSPATGAVGCPKCAPGVKVDEVEFLRPIGAQQPAAPVQNPAEIEHVACNVSKNGQKSNMAQQPAPADGAATEGAAYAELPEPVSLVKLPNDIDGNLEYRNVWSLDELRDFADRTHALRTQQPTPSAAAEVENLRKALQFYADKDHFNIADDGAWDTVSGEPQNYWCDEEGTATVEDGTIARLALAGHQIKFDADEAPQPSPTPQADSQPAPVRDERDDFEKVFPLPSGCIRVGTGYASTGYSNWAAHTHCERWQGWQARAARAPADSVPAWANQAVIEYRYTGGTHWCPLGPAERMKPNFDGVYRLQGGVFPVDAPADSVLEDAETVLRKVLGVVQRYLPPDGPSAHDSLSEIIEIVDPWPLGPLEKP